MHSQQQLDRFVAALVIRLENEIPPLRGNGHFHPGAAPVRRGCRATGFQKREQQQRGQQQQEIAKKTIHTLCLLINS